MSVRNKPSQKCVPISDMDENGTESAPCGYLQKAPESLQGGESSPLRMRLESCRGYGQRDREKETYTIKKILPVVLVTEKDRGQHFVVLVILTWILISRTLILQTHHLYFVSLIKADFVSSQKLITTIFFQKKSVKWCSQPWFWCQTSIVKIASKWYQLWEEIHL